MASEIWLNVRELASALDRIAKEYDASGRAALIAAATTVEASAKANFEDAHSKGEPHVGGNKPNVVSGTLRRSIGFDTPHRLGVAEWATKVEPHTIYARRVELGYPGGKGRGRQKTRAFPYFKPAVKDTRAAVYAKFRTIVTRGL